jgi:DNA replication protein DnaC
VELIYKRYDERLPLVFTTNLKASEVKERYGERIADRMNERAVLVKFTNNSYRRKV